MEDYIGIDVSKKWLDVDFCGIILITLTPTTPFPIQTPIGAAMTLGLLVYLFGCHINPAITVAMFITRQISFIKGCAYVIAQFIGATLALGLIILYVPSAQEQWLIASHAPASSSIGEIIGAAFFAFGVFAAVYNKLDKNILGIVIGGFLLVGITISHNASYGVLNPAVAFATKAWSISYLVMPFLGAIIGALIALALFNGYWQSKSKI